MNEQTTCDLPLIWEGDEVVAHVECLDRSLRHWTGRGLLNGVIDTRGLSRSVFEAPFVVVSHGTEADPVLNYGNRAALELWEISWDELIRMPSRLTAEAPSREERARLLERVTREGFVGDYAGVRIGKSGRRFRIAAATVWNLITPEGVHCGQAAMFRDWTFLD